MSFSELAAGHVEIVEEHLERAGGFAIGTLCSYAPVELLHSFGVLPVRIWGKAEDLGAADGLLQTYICPPVRNLMALGLEGRYDFLEGILHSYTCDATCGLYNIWTRNMEPGFAHMISLPYVDTEESRGYASRELAVLIGKLESLTGEEYSPDRLRRSIRLYNEMRALMREAYELKSEGAPVGYPELFSMNLCGQVLPVEMVIENLHEHLPRWRGGERVSGGVRLLLTGSVITDIELMEFVEDAGGRVVADDTCLGLRLLEGRIEESEPLESLVEYYLSRPPCASRADFPSRKNWLLGTLESSGIDAVIFVHQKFCDPHLSDHPFLKEVLEEKGVPNLQVELEGEGFTGQVRTRIEGFFEMLETR